MLLMSFTAVAVFTYGKGIIAAYAQEVQASAIKAQESSSELDRLKATKIMLTSKQQTVQKTALLASESKQYVYQDKIISDITKYANDAGLTVTNITFTDVKAASVSAAPPAANPATAGQNNNPPSNIKSRIASVSLASPVDYNKMLNFIHSIEQGVFRMRITNIGLSRSTDGGSTTSDVLTIEVFVR